MYIPVWWLVKLIVDMKKDKYQKLSIKWFDIFTSRDKFDTWAPLSPTLNGELIRLT